MIYVLIVMAILSVVYVITIAVEDTGGYMQGVGTVIAITVTLVINGVAWAVYGLTLWLG